MARISWSNRERPSYLQKQSGWPNTFTVQATADIVYHIQSQLAGTKGTWQGRAAAVTAALQVPDDVTTFLESWFGTERHLDYQLNGDMRLVPNYPHWVPRKKAPSLDKWTLFLGINTNSLTPIGASCHLIPETYFSAIFLAFTPLFSPLFTTTHYIYSHSFSNFIVSLLTLSSESIWHVPHRCHPFFVSYHVVSKRIFLQKYQEHHYSMKQFLGFSSILECMAHLLVVERNLTPIYWR